MEIETVDIQPPNPKLTPISIRGNYPAVHGNKLFDVVTMLIVALLTLLVVVGSIVFILMCYLGFQQCLK